jgi:hypothetical protein
MDGWLCVVKIERNSNYGDNYTSGVEFYAGDS